MATLGPLIHNPQCVADLEAKGAVTVDDAADLAGSGFEVVIRSHGVPASVYEACGHRGLWYTMRLVPCGKIHRLAQRAEKRGKPLLVAGDSTHPESWNRGAYHRDRFLFFQIWKNWNA